jgi:hypothetical protein
MILITDFLAARIDEDEALAETFSPDSFPQLYPSPARVLAECEAKRRLIQVYNDGYAVRVVAAVYADHPDWCEEWRP